MKTERGCKCPLTNFVYLAAFQGRTYVATDRPTTGRICQY